MTAAIICSFLSFRRSETAAVAAAEGGATEKKKMKQIRPSGVERMSRFVRHRFMPMAVGYAALRRCHQFECIFLFCLSHLHNDLAIKREYFELLKVFDSICTLFGTLLSLARAIFVLAVASGGNHLSSKILCGYKIIKLRTSTNVNRAMVSHTHCVCDTFACAVPNRWLAPPVGHK